MRILHVFRKILCDLCLSQPDQPGESQEHKYRTKGSRDARLVVQLLACAAHMFGGAAKYLDAHPL
jgi:hypothetical protein